MFFESRGINKIMIESTRKDYLEMKIKNIINDFLSECLLKYTEITEDAIDKFEVEEDEMDTFKIILLKNSVESILLFQSMLISDINSSFPNKTIIERLNQVKENLKNYYDKSLEPLNYLISGIFSLNYYFKNNVIKEIEYELESQIIEIRDVELGKVIKTIQQKKLEEEERLEEEMLKQEYLSELAGEYWSDYYDEVRELRGLDEDSPIF